MATEQEPTVDLRKHLLERVRRAMVTRLSNDLICDPDTDIEAVVDHYTNTTELRIRGYVWGESLGPPQRFPANWKEALKDRFLPRFLRSFMPVKYVYVTAKCLYPDFRPAMPARAHTLAIEVLSYNPEEDET